MGRPKHHPTKGIEKREKLGEKGRQDLGNTPSNKGNQEGSQGLGKTDTPSNKGKQEGGHTIQQGETRREAMGDKGKQDPRERGHTIQQRETRKKTSWETSLETRETSPWQGRHTIQQIKTRRKASWESWE